MVLPTGHKKWNWDQASQFWVVLALYRPLIFRPFLEFRHQKTNWNRPNDLKHRYNFFISSLACKGQLISKCLFGLFNRSKKRTKQFDLTTMIPQVDLFSFVFWKNLKTPKRHFEINWPLKIAHFENRWHLCSHTENYILHTEFGMSLDIFFLFYKGFPYSLKKRSVLAKNV